MTKIKSVIAMVPHTYHPEHDELQGRVFVVEKHGLDVLTHTEDIPDSIDDTEDNSKYDK